MIIDDATNLRLYAIEAVWQERALQEDTVVLVQRQIGILITIVGASNVHLVNRLANMSLHLSQVIRLLRTHHANNILMGGPPTYEEAIAQ